MELNFKSLPKLLDHFKDESVCIEYLEQQRWDGKITCPHCGHERVYRTNRGFKCAGCLKKFSVTVGTVFENSKISLRIWFAAVYLCTAHKKGISSLQLSRDLNITQKTAWFMLHRIREMMKDRAPELLDGIVECDETFVGGKNKNRHDYKKVKESQGRSVKDKTPVFGIMERNGEVMTQVVPDTKAKTLKPIISQMVKEGSIVMTDEWRAYKNLSNKYVHEVINHKEGKYVIGDVYTNNIECFWSLFKRSIFGIYHSVSPKHLHRYTDESSCRFNTRNILDVNRFSLVLENVEGRLTYNQLIKNK